MRIFVTGATGVIGRRVVPQLVAAGHEVTAIGRTPEKRQRLVALGATAADVDLFDPRALRRSIPGHDVVVNLATKIPPSSRAFLPGAWRENDRIRRVASHNLVEAALVTGVQRFVQESFAPIYRDSGDVWIDERTPVKPARYNAGVLEAEAATERFTRAGRTGVVLRFALFYGADSGYTIDTIRSVRKGWAPVFGAPSAFLSSISHDDAATAVVAALQLRAGRYNVVDDEPVRRREFFDSLAAALRVAPPKFPPVWVAKLAGSLGETLSRSLRISNRKLKGESDWRPAVPSVRHGWPAVVRQARSPG